MWSLRCRGSASAKWNEAEKFPNSQIQNLKKGNRIVGL
jgi:hypothetical protein